MVYPIVYTSVGQTIDRQDMDPSNYIETNYVKFHQ